MSLEDKISALTAAMTALTAAITSHPANTEGAAKAAAATTTKTTAATTAKAAATSAKGSKAASKVVAELTLKDVQEKLFAVRETLGRVKAVAIITAYGVAKVDEIPEEKFQRIADACDRALAGKSVEEEPEEEADESGM